MFDNDGIQLFHVSAIRIDICESHTIIYLPIKKTVFDKQVLDDVMNEKYTIRLTWSIKCTTVVLGEIQVHYINKNYIIIKNG